MRHEGLGLPIGVPAIAVAIAFSLGPTSTAHGEGYRVYSGAQANQVMDSLSAGQGWCDVTTQTLDPSTGAVIQSWCQCVSQVVLTAGDRGTENFAVRVAVGPETLCAPPAATAQQQVAAQQQIAQIDAALAQWHSYLQNLGQNCDAWAYNNDATYRAQCDAWMQQEGARGQWYINQLQGQRDALTTMLQTGVPPLAPGGGVPPRPPTAPGGATPATPGGGAGGSGAFPELPRNIPNMEDINRGGG
jgi:hypothetical protein